MVPGICQNKSVEQHRHAKFYRLTKAGKRQLKFETKQWTTVALAMTNALQAT
jgi:PadR family transcriptional regulator PadR